MAETYIKIMRLRFFPGESVKIIASGAFGRIHRIDLFDGGSVEYGAPNRGLRQRCDTPPLSSRLNSTLVELF